MFKKQYEPDDGAFKVLNTNYIGFNAHNTKRKSFSKRASSYNDYKLKAFKSRQLAAVDVMSKRSANAFDVDSNA